MPTATTHHCIRIYHPAEANSSSAHKLLYRILGFYNSPPSRGEYRKYQLLCKALFHSYNFETKTLSRKSLEHFFNKNGYPISLDDEVVKIRHELWDSVESFTIICDGPGTSRKALAFERHKGSRLFKYGFRA